MFDSLVKTRSSALAHVSATAVVQNRRPVYCTQPRVRVLIRPEQTFYDIMFDRPSSGVKKEELYVCPSSRSKEIGCASVPCWQ